MTTLHCSRLSAAIATPCITTKLPPRPPGSAKSSFRAVSPARSSTPLWPKNCPALERCSSTSTGLSRRRYARATRSPAASRSSQSVPTSRSPNSRPPLSATTARSCSMVRRSATPWRCESETLSEGCNRSSFARQHAVDPAQIGAAACGQRGRVPWGGGRRSGRSAGHRLIGSACSAKQFPVRPQNARRRALVWSYRHRLGGVGSTGGAPIHHGEPRRGLSPRVQAALSTVSYFDLKKSAR